MKTVRKKCKKHLFFNKNNINIFYITDKFYRLLITNFLDLGLGTSSGSKSS